MTAPTTPPLVQVLSLVDEVWALRVAPCTPVLVLPDGCMDLVFRGGAEPALLWVGPMTRAVKVAPDTRTDLVGVRFRPGGGPTFAGVDARDLLDRDLPAGDPRILDALLAARGPSERRRLMLTWLARRPRDAPDPLVLAAAGRILAAGGAIRIPALARSAGVSDRTLHRRFLAAVGHGPKVLCRIARLWRARSLAAAGLGGADLAAAAGYADQAHLCHELASFGATSAALVR